MFITYFDVLCSVPELVIRFGYKKVQKLRLLSVFEILLIRLLEFFYEFIKYSSDSFMVFLNNLRGWGSAEG